MNTKKEFSKVDIFFLVSLIIIGIAITLWIYLPSKETGNTLTVTQNGTVLMTLPLDKDTEQIITDEEGHKNVFYIKQQSVTMFEANCHDHTCVNTASISRTGESIVCLPHRLVLQITSNTENSNELDAVAR